MAPNGPKWPQGAKGAQGGPAPLTMGGVTKIKPLLGKSDEDEKMSFYHLGHLKPLKPKENQEKIENPEFWGMVGRGVWVLFLNPAGCCRRP